MAPPLQVAYSRTWIQIEDSLNPKFPCQTAHIISSDFVILAIKMFTFGNIVLNSRKWGIKQPNLLGMSDTGRPSKIIINKEIEAHEYENVFLVKSN